MSRLLGAKRLRNPKNSSIIPKPSIIFIKRRVNTEGSRSAKIRRSEFTIYGKGVFAEAYSLLRRAVIGSEFRKSTVVGI